MKNYFKMLSIIAVSALLASCGDDDTGGEANSSLQFDKPVSKICGNSNILGIKEDSFSNGSCGIQNPVRVYAVSGVKLSEPALVSCEAATQLNVWVKKSAKPAASSMGKTLTGIDNIGSYGCRSRNHKAGAKLSEHAYGKAIDIGGVTFGDGSHASVLNDYHSRKYNGFFKQVRQGACGPFGTVLGPGVRLHDNHFHFDVASYSMGAYCK